MTYEINLEKIAKKFEKNYAYCDALLLQFKKPLYLDLEIPDAYEIYSLVNISLRKLSHEVIPLSKVNCLYTLHDENKKNAISIEKLERVLKDIELSEQLFDILKESESESELKFYLDSCESKFGREWHMGKGTLYRFRNGEREKAIKRVEESLPYAHIEKIKLIGDNFQEYIGFTNSPCKIEN